MGGHKYTVTGESAAVAASETPVNLIGGTTVKPGIFDIVIGCQGTAADGTAIVFVQRATTAASGGSAFTPLPLDPDSPAAIATAHVAGTTEPTYTTSGELMEIALNQRATFRWVAAPGAELWVPKTTANGIGIYETGVALKYSATFMFVE